MVRRAVFAVVAAGHACQQPSAIAAVVADGLIAKRRRRGRGRRFTIIAEVWRSHGVLTRAGTAFSYFSKVDSKATPSREPARPEPERRSHIRLPFKQCRFRRGLFPRVVSCCRNARTVCVD